MRRLMEPETMIFRWLLKNLQKEQKELNDAVSGMNNLLSNVDTMTSTGKELITQTEGLLR